MFCTDQANALILDSYLRMHIAIKKVDVHNTTTYGQLAVTGTANLSQSGAINVNIVPGARLVIGDTLGNFISASTLVAPTGGFNVTDNSRLLSFAATVNGGSSVDLTAVDDVNTSVSQSNAATGNKGGAGAAQKLDAVTALNPSGDWSNVISALNLLRNDQEITDAVNQIVPTFVGATNTAIIGTTSTALRIVRGRQESNFGLANSGINSGEDFQENRNVWLKTFGSRDKQDNKEGVTGYASKAHGLILGTDKDITRQARLGWGASYFNAELNSNNDNNQVNVDSFLGLVYGSYSLDDRTED